MSETTAHPLRQTAGPPESAERPAGGDAAAEFERLYRAQVDAVTAFFARRSADPQTVADLTADTFVQVIISFGAFDPGKGSARAWVFGIARRIYAAHCEAHSQQRDKVVRLAGLQPREAAQVLGVDPVDQVPDLVGGQFPAARQPLHPAPLLAVFLAVRGVDPPGDAEHPGTCRALARVEGGKRRDGRDEGVRGQVGHGVRLRAAPGEVGGDRRYVRPVQHFEPGNGSPARPAVLRRRA